MRKKPKLPPTRPYPVRFPNHLIAEVDRVGEMYHLSRPDVIRMATAAGVIALRQMGYDGLAAAVAKHFTDGAVIQPSD